MFLGWVLYCTGEKPLNGDRYWSHPDVAWDSEAKALEHKRVADEVCSFVRHEGHVHLVAPTWEHIGGKRVTGMDLGVVPIAQQLFDIDELADWAAMAAELLPED